MTYHVEIENHLGELRHTFITESKTEAQLKAKYFINQGYRFIEVVEYR